MGLFGRRFISAFSISRDPVDPDSSPPRKRDCQRCFIQQRRVIGRYPCPECCMQWPGWKRVCQWNRPPSAWRDL